MGNMVAVLDDALLLLLVVCACVEAGRGGHAIASVNSAVVI